tara:strand:+ start:1094 stop:1342 length:249 start_codon:yes stop_codon:yes gene_type:complete
MDHLNLVASEVFENRESYTTNDYLVIMNILKEQYHKLNGDIPPETGCDKELESDDEYGDDVSYSNYYADENDGYLSDYIESY